MSKASHHPGAALALAHCWHYNIVFPDVRNMKKGAVRQALAGITTVIFRKRAANFPPLAGWQSEA
jgi:hypothetical protein